MQKPVPHGLKVVPVFPIEVEDNFWVMDRLFSTARAYFNREASRAFAIDTGAKTLPVIKTEKELSTLVTANGYAIKLNPNAGEDFFWRSPDAGIYAALKDDCEYLLGNLYGALNQMALMAQAKTGNPYQSGTSKGADAGAIKSFLSLLCSPVMAGLRKAIRAVQKYRDQDELPLQIHGMNKFDVQAIELEINRCLTWNSIPGIPQSSRKASIRRANQAYVGSDMNDEQLSTFEKELDEADLPEVDSKSAEVVGAAPAGQDQMTNATTGRPQGFAPGQISQSATKMRGAPKQPTKQAVGAA